MVDFKRNLIYKVAKAYYEDNLTQQAIGNRYGISRIMVSRLLKKALKEKIVKINISQPSDLNIDIEKLLEKKYGLHDVFIVSCNSSDEQNVLNEVGAAAAGWLISRLEGTEIISLSWGQTLLSLINHLPQTNLPHIKVVQMIGGLGVPEADTHGADLARRMASAFHSKPRILSSPGIVSSKTICDALKSDLQIDETLKLAAKADIAIMGIGRFDSSSNEISTNIILSDEDKECLLNKNAVGDICLQFHDNNGTFISGFLEERIVGLSKEEILGIPRRIGIAGGPKKFDTILAACKGNFINVLITDVENGKKLLKY